MKYIDLLFLAVLAGVLFSSCRKQGSTVQVETYTYTDSNAVGVDSVGEAINRFLSDSIGSLYAKADVTIPVCDIVDSELSADRDTLRVWGDFFVYNYDVVGDTLKCVSGGAHPGLLCLLRTPRGYEVAHFDAVTDGAGYEQSARRIFGSRYDDFRIISSNHQRRDSLRLHATAIYAFRNVLSVTLLQDYGWPVVTLPAINGSYD